MNSPITEPSAREQAYDEWRMHRPAGQELTIQPTNSEKVAWLAGFDAGLALAAELVEALEKTMTALTRYSWADLTGKASKDAYKCGSESLARYRAATE